MSDNDNEIIDVEEVELVETPNVPDTVEAKGTHSAQPPIEGRDWSTYSTPERRCTASSTRTGEQCKNVAIKGGNVCRYHGGAAKQVKQAARIRLENAADLMAKKLLQIAITGDTDTVKLAAIRDALDRAGLKAPAEVVLSQGETKPYESVFEGIYSGPPDMAPSDGLPTDYTGYGADGLEDAHSPAPAYADTGSEIEADAGEMQPTSASSGYDDLHPDYIPRYTDSPSWAEHYESSGHGSARRSRRDEFDRDRPRQAREVHITGEDAMRLANEANRAIGALPPLQELESPHRRYPRP